MFWFSKQNLKFRIKFLFRIIINEVCLYSVHPENTDWTCFEQKAELDIKSFFGFEGTAEKLAVKEYSKSIGKSKDIMEHYIQVSFQDTINRRLEVNL